MTVDRTRTAPAVVTGALMFTDIVGFTEYTALRGDAAAVALLAVQERVVTGLLPDRSRIVKELGDGLLLWFEEPASALRTGLELQHQFELESASTGQPLWVRMAVHAGRALRRGSDLIGHDVNVTARIVDVAGPGELLVSDAARSACGAHLPAIAFCELGPVVMKGIPDAVRLWRAEPEPSWQPSLASSRTSAAPGRP